VLKDGQGGAEKPWLAVILDDDSRAVTGYTLFFGSPSAIQTALALRQEIWRKGRPGQQLCGIPEDRASLRPQVGRRYSATLSARCQNARPASVSVSAINHNTRAMAAFEIMSSGGFVFHLS
jgi:hypothetical protein